ncbi:hypothetical protein CALCODRAFT_508003 [Calocera cornea HHB12733]|uniref:Uncharacterized protein n=1 Tax=Calocera cornea HHB12733 TaxID=1353952 RepID=A0A165GZZ1_9BASI|nr:hypothetical protein CALCODRAFT_508003 [Calocera cornea HHB12733]
MVGQFQVPRASYSVSRDLGPIFSLATWMMFTVLAAVLIVVSWGAYGYDTISVFSSDFNGTQTSSWWFNGWVPGPLSFLLPDSSCQAYTYRLGDSFRTSTRIFTWQIENVNQNPEDEDGNWESGGLYTELPYSNAGLEYCDVADITITADMFQQSVQLDTRIMCTLPVPILAKTTVLVSPFLARDTYSNNPWVNSSIGINDILGLANPPQANVSQAVDLLTIDFWYYMFALLQATNGTSPSVLGSQILFYGAGGTNTWCPAAFIGQPGWCTSQDEFNPPQFDLGPEQLYFPISTDNISLLLTTPNSEDFEGAFWNNSIATPISNLVRVMHSAARTDLGGFRSNNVFLNKTALHQQLDASVAVEWLGSTYSNIFNDNCGPNVFCGASSLLGNEPALHNFSALPLNATGPSIIETTYLCNRQTQKSGLALFFAITSGTWSNFFAAYGLWMFASAWYLKRKMPEHRRLRIGQSNILYKRLYRLLAPARFGTIFSLITWLFLGVLAGLLLVISSAAYGYETISISTTDFNYTQTLWFDKYIPQALKPKSSSTCQPFTYRVGDSFRTSTRLFTWVIANVDQTQDEQGNWEAGSLYTALPYSNVEMQYCDVTDITITVDLYQRMTQLDVRVERVLFLFIGEPGWCPSPDEFEVPQYEYVLGLTPGNRSLKLQDGSFGAQQFSFLKNLQQESVYDPWNPAVVPFSFNGSLNNMIRAMHSAARADFGSARPNNIFQNASALQQQLTRTAALTLNGAALSYNLGCNTSVLCGAAQLLGWSPNPGGQSGFTGLPLTSTGPSIIETTYLCNRQAQKSAAELFFSITSGTWSNLFGRLTRRQHSLVFL